MYFCYTYHNPVYLLLTMFLHISRKSKKCNNKFEKCDFDPPQLGMVTSSPTWNKVVCQNHYLSYFFYIPLRIKRFLVLIAFNCRSARNRITMLMSFNRYSTYNIIFPISAMAYICMLTYNIVTSIIGPALIG